MEIKYKKIAFLLVGLNAGGIENYLLRFIQHYKSEIKGTVYCKSGKGGDLEDEYRNLGVQIRKQKIGYFNPLDYRRLYSDFQYFKYDAVVDFTGNFSGIPLSIAKLAGIRTRISWYRNADDKFKKTTLKKLYNKICNTMTLRSATHILSNSQSALNYFYRGYDWQRDNRFEVIYNGINADSFLDSRENLRQEFNIPMNAFVVGNVGRFNEQKNHKTAIEVAIQLCTENNDIYFIFCGKGVDEEYNTLIEKRNLKEKVVLTGLRRDIVKVLNTLNCFYFPSLLEGQPNALIEAMLVGVPFVASDIEPVKETVPQNLHAFLVPPLDIVIAKQRILEIRNNNSCREKLKVSEWAKIHFDASNQFKKFFDKLED